MFQNSPPSDTRSPLPIVRCRPGRPLEVVACCAMFRGIDTHYLNGATFICSGVESCVGCQANFEPRWQGYVIVRQLGGTNFAILQFTPIAGKVMEDWCRNGKSLLGARMRLTRLGNHLNAPLSCRTMGTEHGVKEFSTEVLEHCLERIYGKKRDPDLCAIGALPSSAA